MKLHQLIGIAVCVFLGSTVSLAAELQPRLKVLICTGDYGMYAQDRVPLIKDAVTKAAPNADVSWESHQSFNFTKALENPGYAERFDVVVMGDLAIGQLTPKAQQNLVDFAKHGGGIVWVLWAKSTIPFKGSTEAVPMPLQAALPIAYPDFTKPAEGAAVLPSTHEFWKGIDWTPLTVPAAVEKLPTLLCEREVGSGRVMTLAGAFGPSWTKNKRREYEKAPGGWDAFPQLGEVWVRVLNAAGKSSPIRDKDRATVDQAITEVPLNVSITFDGSKKIDKIRAADFSIVALQQLYNEDGGRGEDLFLALNPRDWFDRRSQEVLPNVKGVKSDKPAFFKDYDIRGIYMAGNSYGSYGKWTDETYAAETAKAIDAKKKWPEQIVYFQAGNEPPLNAKYVAFHKRFVGAVLAGVPEYKVVGPNKAFNVSGVSPEEMQLYIDECGSTTDVLNCHIYAQPPSTVRAEAIYWSDRAAGKMRQPGPPPVMFTESDAWNQGDSQFNYLMERAFTFLPEKRIIANFQYCMRPRSEGGSYRFGVLQPEGPMSANYNGYWVWRNLRGDMLETNVDTAIGSEHVRAISSRSADGRTFSTVIYFDGGYFDAASGKRASSAKVSLRPMLPPGEYEVTKDHVTWTDRTSSPVDSKQPLTIELTPYSAAAITWVKR